MTASSDVEAGGGGLEPKAVDADAAGAGASTSVGTSAGAGAGAGAAGAAAPPAVRRRRPLTAEEIADAKARFEALPRIVQLVASSSEAGFQKLGRAFGLLLAAAVLVSQAVSGVLTNAAAQQMPGSHYANADPMMMLFTLLGLVVVMGAAVCIGVQCAGREPPPDADPGARAPLHRAAASADAQLESLWFWAAFVGRLAICPVAAVFVRASLLSVLLVSWPSGMVVGVAVALAPVGTIRWARPMTWFDILSTSVLSYTVGTVWLQFAAAVHMLCQSFFNSNDIVWQLAGMFFGPVVSCLLVAVSLALMLFIVSVRVPLLAAGVPVAEFFMLRALQPTVALAAVLANHQAFALGCLQFSRGCLPDVLFVVLLLVAGVAVGLRFAVAERQDPVHQFVHNPPMKDAFFRTLGDALVIVLVVGTTTVVGRTTLLAWIEQPVNREHVSVRVLQAVVVVLYVLLFKRCLVTAKTMWAKMGPALTGDVRRAN